MTTILDLENSWGYKIVEEVDIMKLITIAAIGFFIAAIWAGFSGVSFVVHPVFNVWILIGFVAGIALYTKIGLLNAAVYLLATLLNATGNWMIAARAVVGVLTIIEVFMWYSLLGLISLKKSKFLN